MKKEVILALFLVFTLLFSNLASAQSYSFTARVVDDLRMAFADDEGKVEIALEVREKQVDSAIEEAKAGNIEEAIEFLEDAKEKLEVVQEKVLPDICDQVDESVDEVTKKIIENKDIDPEFSEYLDGYLKEEEKTKLTAEHSEKLFEYCDELAKQDYELMLQDEKCNPDDAPDWLRGEIDDKMEENQKEAGEKMLEIFTTCINDPRECDCSDIPIASEKTKCEKGKALAIRCEFQNDESACRELDNLDIEMPSNLPKFLQVLFQQRINNAINSKEKEMMERHAPPECIAAGVVSREECEAIMMEKYAPSECVLAGATTKEECDKIMFSIHGPPPNECMENGEFIGEEACNEKMVSSGMIPKECIKDGMPISEEECRAIMEEKGMMGPPECKGLNKEECDAFFAEQGIGPGMTPPPIDCEGITEEECRILMEEQGIVMAPPECKGLNEEECNRLIIEKGLFPQDMIDPKVAPGKEFKIPQECVGMSFQECEDYLMGNYMPQECVDAGALTPKDCKRIMLPQECKQAGALSPEECGAIMINKGMPQECQDAGALTPEECAKIMSKNIVVGGTPGSEVDYLNKKGISFDEIPDVCVSGSNFIRSMECDEALAGMGITLPPPKDISNIPLECIKDGVPLSPQECKVILKEKMIHDSVPELCRKAGITNPEECGRFIEKQKRDTGMGMMKLPPECYTMSVVECKEFMDEHGMEPIDVMGLMKKMEKQKSKQKEKCEGEECDQPQCTEGQVKMRTCPGGIEVVDSECVNGEWVGLDMACLEPKPKEEICCEIEAVVPEPVPKYEWRLGTECQLTRTIGVRHKIVSNEYCEEEKPKCEEGETTMRDCDGIEMVDCMCSNGEWMCSDMACPILIAKPQEIPRECIEMGIEDESACEIVMSKINEERIINGDQMIVDDEGNEDYISNDEINKIVDEAEREVEEFEPDVEDANEIKEELEVIEDEIVEIEIEQEKFEEPEVEESAPEPEQESAPEPESESEPAPATGEAVREIQPQDNFLTRFFDRIFG